MTRTTTQTLKPQSLMDQFGARIASQLDGAAQQLPRDLSERLRAARMQALAHRRTAETAQTATELAGGGSAVLGGGFGLWGRAASLLPLLALTVGLLGIGTFQDQMRASEIAEVDAELLTSELPTAAYTDPGFAQYLKHGAQD